jgi:N-acetylglucosaminyldiphosphoundecaprenol N-acetyl-beta-D-mannosaminyltransferase
MLQASVSSVSGVLHRLLVALVPPSIHKIDIWSIDERPAASIDSFDQPGLMLYMGRGGGGLLKKIRLGRIHADYVSLEEAIDAIEGLVVNGRGGYVVTPNVDHVVQAEGSAVLREVYAHAALSLVDGMPLKWMSHLLGDPLPEKVSGSDLVHPLLVRAAEKELTVYFLGSAPGVGQKAAEILKEELPKLKIVGIASPPFGFEKNPTEEAEIMEAVSAVNPDIVLVALGCPKQELLMYRWYERLAPAVLLGIGASLDFIAGHVQRSPGWVSKLGLEWIHRILQDPKRMAKRYLGRDMAIVPVFLKMLMRPKADRVFYN